MEKVTQSHRAGVNFINILRVPFLYKSAIFCQNVTRKKLLKRLSYEKHARKTLMKLTAVPATD